ncbi:hypothetical protein MOMA_07756 [Moraxella macacae 0408225]|uniref:Uncharacterized protein n=1 Tax=Moraxella macacae 0408225 TaxID=1230338 RepID=L2F5U8_9GAMM|nr:hypothetical protein [Moraxella macacae]ELA08439.1 hypothetical protein MOMA_07756 [Moraxella macacae 0408225]
MKKIYILIKELGSFEQLAISESLANFLWRDELGLTAVDSRDVRVRNLEFSYSVYEASIENYRNLAMLAELYHKMDTAIFHYQQRYSVALVNFIVGDIDTMLQGFDKQGSDKQNSNEQGFGKPDSAFDNNSDNFNNFNNFNNNATQATEQATEAVDIYTLPKLVLQRIKQYFVEPFLITDVKLSEEKHVNIKYIDDTAEFRIIFTVLDVALPDDSEQYQYQPLVIDVFGRYQDKFSFYLDQVKTNKDRYFGYDNALYDKRQAYLNMILSRCKDEQGQDLETALKQVAKEFMYDFWLE